MADSAGQVEINYIAELARLELTAEEKANLEQDVAEVLGYIEQLNEVDVEGVEPTAHAAPIYKVFRPDEAAETLPRQTALDNAPDVIEGAMVKVPVVIGGDEAMGGG